MSGARSGLVLGVDGGGSKTVAMVADLDERELGRGGSGGSCIYRTASPTLAVEQIVEACHGALRAASIPSRELDAAVFSLAGADWPEDVALLERRLRDWIGPTVPMRVVNDAMGAVWAGTSDGVAVGVVAGTGANVGARAADAGEWAASFWMPVPSGAVGLGLAALRAVADDTLRRGPHTAMTQTMPAAFGERSAEGLVHAFTALQSRPRLDLATYAPQIMAHAREGDARATAIVGELVATLASFASVAADRVGLAPGHPVVLAGGLALGGADLIVPMLRASIPDLVQILLVEDPVRGAVRAAARLRSVV